MKEHPVNKLPHVLLTALVMAVFAAPAHPAVTRPVERCMGGVHVGETVLRDID
jgi:hypothetical protein